MSDLQSWPGAVYLVKDPFPVAIHVAFILDKILFLFITGEIIFSVAQCLKSCKALLAQILGRKKINKKRKQHKSHCPLRCGYFLPEVQKIQKILSKHRESFIRATDSTVSLQAGRVLFLGTLF